MLRTNDTKTTADRSAPHGVEYENRLRFGTDNDFQSALRRKVDAFFKMTGRRQRDCPQMYVKTGILLSSFALSYVLLVFFAHVWWLTFPLAAILGLSVAFVAFNVQHDGGHGGYSNHPWINKLAAMTLDLLGGSSYFWRYKHGVFHHTYCNITGHDTDIDLGILGRLTPHQERFWFHRFQHIYLWPLYGFIAIKWHLIDDFKDLIRGRVGHQKVPRPKGWDLVVFIAGKLVFLSLAFGIPMLMHSWWHVLVIYGFTALVTGVVLSTVFQLAHCVEEAEFPVPKPDTNKIENAWSVHQIETTVDFARSSRMAAWLLGGLNFQVEHHLFPRICHINYPAMSKIVEEACKELGVRYTAHKTFLSGLVSHYKFLKRMGNPIAQ